MSIHKIQPWNMQVDENQNYIKKLKHLSNFSSHKNIKKFNDKKNQLTLNVAEKLKRYENNGGSANTTLQNFNKTNRSEYQHRVTKLVFNENSKKKYKFQPDTEYARKTIKAYSAHKLQKSTNQLSAKKLKQLSIETRKSRKQIYYNLTEMNSPLNAISNAKCHTESCMENEDRKLKILEMFKRDKKQQIISRELSVERKIYILQSGNRDLRNSLSRQVQSSRKSVQRCKNMIEEICFAERQYSKERKKQLGGKYK